MRFQNIHAIALIGAYASYRACTSPPFLAGACRGHRRTETMPVAR